MGVSEWEPQNPWQPPARIDKRCKHGVIFQSFDRDGTMLTDDSSDDPAKTRAQADASAMKARLCTNGPVTLVAYDGDSGRMMVTVKV